MRYSESYIPTLREAPAEAELLSHRLLLRAGFVRKLSSGIYSWLPLGQRVLARISALVRQEFGRIGGQEVTLPVLHPIELWRASGRDDLDVLFHVEDRFHREMVLGMTHEEVATHVVAADVRSYRQLPMLIYQIQPKFRDEQRPRGGVLRGREFLMNDAYSFHEDQRSLEETYESIKKCYSRLLTMMGLEFLIVEAESGAGGGYLSHEFTVPVDSGEDILLLCDSCGYGANLERCEIGAIEPGELPEQETARLVKTPGKRTVEEVTAFLQVPSQKLLKTLLLESEEGEVVAALVRGDRDLNESKLRRVVGDSTLEMASAETVQRVTGAEVGFTGPQGLENVRILADQEVAASGNYVTGANATGAHMVDMNPGRDFGVDDWADIRVAVDHDPCPKCGGLLEQWNGIEAAHIFQVGQSYSDAAGASFLDREGKPRRMLMGTYGFGITRATAAIAECLADADGLVWPATVAPFDVVLLCLDLRRDASAADKLYRELLEEGLEVLYDDRDERAGVKFKDADLIGIPIQLVIGRSIDEGEVEMRVRARKLKQKIHAGQAAMLVSQMHRELVSERMRAARQYASGRQAEV